MSDQEIEFTTAKELCELVRSEQQLILVGGQSKPALSNVPPTVRRVTTTSYAGIEQYEPSEFTFTAKSGTRLSEIINVLAEKQQYLPFDPMLVQQNATLGGTLAAGLSGPGRQRYGGIRDFVLGVQFVAGDGQLIRAGGKVVKNAAGFDIPKLLVGSCGRFAAITELTFKVFPRPREFHSRCITVDTHENAASTIATLARGRWELDAIDYDSQNRAIRFRIGAELGVADLIAEDIANQLPNQTIENQGPNWDWKCVNELTFAGPEKASIVKVPMDLSRLPNVSHWCDNHSDSAAMHTSVAGAIGWIATTDSFLPQLNQYLSEIGLSGLVLKSSGLQHGCLIGRQSIQAIDAAIKSAMDPPGRFPSF